MAGSFLFTRNTAGRHGGASHVRPLLRAGNHNIPTFDRAVQDAVANQLVTVDGKTVYMPTDVAFMMIGRKSELRDEVASGNDMPYGQIRSVVPDTDLHLYRTTYNPSPMQTDHIYVLAAAPYWNNAFGADLTRVNINDNNGRSRSLDLGSNAGNDRDPRMITTHIDAVHN